MKLFRDIVFVFILACFILIIYYWLFEVGVVKKSLARDLPIFMIPDNFTFKPSCFLPYLADQNKQYFDSLQPMLFHRSPNFVRLLMLTFGQFFLSIELYVNQSEETRVFDESLVFIPLTAAFLEVVIGFARDFVHFYVLMCFQDIYIDLVNVLDAFKWYVGTCNLMCLPEGKLYSSFLYDFLPVLKEIKLLVFKKEVTLQDIINLGVHLDLAKLKLTAFEAYFKELYPTKELPNSFYQINFKIDMLREAYQQKFSYISLNK